MAVENSAPAAPSMSSSKETKEPSILTSIARHIPGLSVSSSSGTGTTTSSSSNPANKKNRSRKPKSQPMTTSVLAAASASASDKHEDNLQFNAIAHVESAATPSVSHVPVNVPEVEALGEAEEKKTSAVEACQKRIRAANKKIQRIATYEEKTEALNADQQRAVASKPALVAVVKELEELLVILRAEEAEDEARGQRNAALEEKRQARAIEAGVASAQSATDSKVLVLLQFLHLHGLYTQQNTGFAPPVLPPVVANATGQEVAAVRMLKDRFTNGPLLGGHGGAVEALNKIASESSEEVLTGVPYSRIKELIAGLTSTPADESLTASNHNDIILPESSAPAGPSDSVTALVDGATDAPVHDAPSFLNASELEQVPSSEAKVTSWPDEVEVAPAAPPAQEPISTPTHAPAPIHDPVAAPPAPPADAWGSSAGATVDWATEDSGALPSLPELQPAPVATLNASAGDGAASSVDADGFQPARRGGPGQGQGHGQGQGRGPRGPPGGGRNGVRGGNGEEGRGGGRGGGGGGPFRGRSDGNWERRGPSLSTQGQGPNGPRDDGFTPVNHHGGGGGEGGHRGGRGKPYRGGEGGGRGGGRGPREGGFRGGQGQGQGQGQNKVERPVGNGPAANASAAPAAPNNRW
ncbi:BQ2448_4596 [Microbotryum intermedium]|uniref:BQ2448_4596 protein n=1 Tax=Microbotryum intermedium TaxID=269621 RepID=A0A238FDK1_9BASI|nr:BQ2448_4596 [Microbotryum intermedium]